jgi:hypothetical protein
VYVVMSEVLLRVGPIIALAILNALIIHKFLKIARKRQILKGINFNYYFCTLNALFSFFVLEVW